MYQIQDSYATGRKPTTGGKQMFLLPLLTYAAKSYLDVLKQQQIAKEQARVLEEQRKLEQLRLQRQAIEAQVAEEKKGIGILPILIIGALILFGGKKS